MAIAPAVFFCFFLRYRSAVLEKDVGHPQPSSTGRTFVHNMLCIAQAAVSLTTTTPECHVPGLTTSPDSLRHWRCPATHLRLWRSHVRVAAVGLASAGVGVSDEICVRCPRIWTPHTVTPEIHQLSRSEVCGDTGDQWSLPNVVPFFFSCGTPGGRGSASQLALAERTGKACATRGRSS